MKKYVISTLCIINVRETRRETVNNENTSYRTKTNKLKRKPKRNWQQWEYKQQYKGKQIKEKTEKTLAILGTQNTGRRKTNQREN